MQHLAGFHRFPFALHVACAQEGLALMGYFKKISINQSLQDLRFFNRNRYYVYTDKRYSDINPIKTRL